MSNLHFQDIQAIVNTALIKLYDDAVIFIGRYKEYRYSFLTSIVLTKGSAPPISPKPTADLLEFHYQNSENELEKRFNIIYSLKNISRHANTSNPINRFALTLSIIDTSIRQANSTINNRDYTPLIYEILGNELNSGICCRLLYETQKELIAGNLAGTNTLYQQYFYDFHSVDKTKMQIIEHKRDNMAYQIDTIIFLSISANSSQTTKEIINKII